MHPIACPAAQCVPFPVINVANALANGPRAAISSLPRGGEVLEVMYVILSLGWIWYAHEI